MALLKDVLKKAIETNDAETIGSCVDQMRTKLGMNYQKVLSFAQKQVPSLTEDQWEDFLMKAEEREAMS